MKKFLLSFIALIALLAGCNQSASPEDVAKVTYEWEKATLKADYEREQELLYKEGTYEIHKDSPSRDNSLKYEDMKIEVYYDEKNEWYYSLFSYTNPEQGNKVEDSYVVREKNEELKIDIEGSRVIDQEKIRNSIKREACIHCE
jgi:outer membrane lipoprotein-sorting protein